MSDPSRLAEDISDLMGPRARRPRALPRALRRDAAELERAARMASHPKLRRQVDAERAARALGRLRDHLAGIDPREARRTALLNMAAAVSFVFIALSTAALFILVQEGVIGPRPALSPEVTRQAQP